MSNKTKAASDTPGKDIVAVDGAAPLADKSPPEGIRALALDYPLALIAGGVVAGVLIGSLLPRGGRGKLSRGAVALAGVAGELGLTYARKAIGTMAETAHAAADAGSRAAEVVTERGGDAIATAGDSISTYSGKAADTAEGAIISLRHSAEGLARQVIRLTSQLRH